MPLFLNDRQDLVYYYTKMRKHHQDKIFRFFVTQHQSEAKQQVLGNFYILSNSFLGVYSNPKIDVPKFPTQKNSQHEQTSRR